MIDWQKIQEAFNGVPYWVFTDTIFQEAHKKNPDIYSQTTRAKYNLPEFLCTDFGMQFNYPDVEFAHGNIVLSGDGFLENVPGHRHFPTTELRSVSVPFLIESRERAAFFQFGRKSNVKVSTIDESLAYVFNSSKTWHEIICMKSHIYAFVIFEQVAESDIPKILEFYGRTAYEA